MHKHNSSLEAPPRRQRYTAQSGLQMGSRPHIESWPAGNQFACVVRSSTARSWHAMGMDAPRHLLLLRHAKSSWDDPSLADHDRPLAPRGRRAAKLMAAHLRRSGADVSLVLCSSARRALQTLELVAPPGEVRIEDELYGASADRLLARLVRVPDTHGAVLLIGHNPAMQELADGLAPGGGLAEQKFPTGALATLAFGGSWRGLEWGCAELTEFVRPRDLTE